MKNTKEYKEIAATEKEFTATKKQRLDEVVKSESQIAETAAQVARAREEHQAKRALRKHKPEEKEEF